MAALQPFLQSFPLVVGHLPGEVRIPGRDEVLGPGHVSASVQVTQENNAISFKIISMICMIIAMSIASL